MTDTTNDLKPILEAALFAAGEPLNMGRLLQLFDDVDRPEKSQIKQALQDLQNTMQDRGVELVEVGNGYRFQAKPTYAPWLMRLWEKKPPRFSRALLETLALIAYRQPITRAEIEDIRGVVVSSNIVKTLLDREWVKIVGYRDLPGKPALFGTTKDFLDYFNLKSLSDLPPLKELMDLDEIEQKLGVQLNLAVEPASESESESELESSEVAEAERMNTHG